MCMAVNEYSRHKKTGDTPLIIISSIAPHAVHEEHDNFIAFSTGLTALPTYVSMIMMDGDVSMSESDFEDKSPIGTCTSHYASQPEVR